MSHEFLNLISQLCSEYRNKLRRMKMDDKVPDDIYKFSDDDLKHLLREVDSFLVSLGIWN